MKLVHIITCNFFGPTILVNVVNTDNATAACVSVGGVINGFAAYVTSKIPNSTAS